MEIFNKTDMALRIADYFVQKYKLPDSDASFLRQSFIQMSDEDLSSVWLDYKEQVGDKNDK